MTIYDRGRGKRPINPGIALYNFWHMVLRGACPEQRGAEGHIAAAVTFADGWSINFTREGPTERPTISYGGTFVIAHDGSFRLTRPFGVHQRNIVARNTFLDWSHWRGYNWFVNTERSDMAWSYRYGQPLKDFNNPIHYVSEDVMGARRSSTTWLKPVWSDEYGWHIGFKDFKPYTYDHRPPITQGTFEWFNTVRLRRYRLLERDEKLYSGEWTLENRRVVTREEREEREGRAIQAIMAAFEVGQPARTVSLRRKQEEEGLWPLNGCR